MQNVWPKWQKYKDQSGFFPVCFYIYSGEIIQDYSKVTFYYAVVVVRAFKYILNIMS